MCAIRLDAWSPQKSYRRSSEPTNSFGFADAVLPKSGSPPLQRWGTSSPRTSSPRLQSVSSHSRSRPGLRPTMPLVPLVMPTPPSHFIVDDVSSCQTTPMILRPPREPRALSSLIRMAEEGNIYDERRTASAPPVHPPLHPRTVTSPRTPSWRNRADLLARVPQVDKLHTTMDDHGSPQRSPRSARRVAVPGWFENR